MALALKSALKSDIKSAIKSGAVAPAPAGTLRAVSNRNMLLNTKAAGFHSLNAIEIKTSPVPLTVVRFVHANGIVDPSSGTAFAGIGGTAGFQDAIEYPVGSGTVIGTAAYSGTAIGTAASGAIIESDDCALTVTIPANTPFAHSTWYYDNNGGGIIYCSGITRLANDNFEYGASATVPIAFAKTNAAFGGSGTSNAGASKWTVPTLIVAVATTQADALWGDSIQYGLRNPPADAYYRAGITAKKYPTGRVFMNFGQTGMQAGPTGAASFGVLMATQIQLAKYFIYQLYNAARNNITAGQSAATIKTNQQSDLAALKAASPSSKNTMETLIPRSSSTDLWTTTVNQTPTDDAIRVAVNNNIKNGLVAGNDNGYFDMAATLEVGTTGVLDVSGQGAVTDAIFTVGGVFTSASYTFTTDNVEDWIVTNGAGVAGVPYTTNIFSVTPPHTATMNTNPPTPIVAGGTAFIATISQDGQHPTARGYIVASLNGVNFGLIP